MSLRASFTVGSGLGLLLSIAASSEAQPVLYVDAGATGPTHDGSSWCSAFLYLQDALAAAEASGGRVTEIRIAEGVCTADQCAVQIPGSREASFQGMDNVALLGGFAGCGALDPDERDIEVQRTILRGETGTPEAVDDDAYAVGDTGTYGYPLPEVTVSVDIMPGVCPNGLHPLRRRGSLEVAVAGTGSLDVKQIDRDSLILARLDGEGQVRVHSAQEYMNAFLIADTVGYGEPCVCPPAEPDGRPDLEFRVPIARVIEYLDLRSVPPGEMVRLVVVGRLFDGRRFEGVDCILIDVLNDEGRTPRSKSRSDGSTLRR